MKKDILYFKKLNVNGFVFGILNKNGSVNKIQNMELVELAEPFPCSFHRAFDVSREHIKNLEDVIDCGFKTILTSGHPNSAVEGIEHLNLLVEKAKGRIEIMPGGGLRSSNIELLKFNVPSSYYHSSAILKNDIADLDEVKRLKEKLS